MSFATDGVVHNYNRVSNTITSNSTTELVDKLDHLQREYESLQQRHTDLETAKAAQEQEFNRIHEEDLLRMDSLQSEMTAKVSTLSAEKDDLFAVKEDTFAQLITLQTESSQRSSDFESLEKDLKNVIEQKDHELEELRVKYQELEEKYQVRWFWMRHFFAVASVGAVANCSLGTTLLLTLHHICIRDSCVNNPASVQDFLCIAMCMSITPQNITV